MKVKNAKLYSLTILCALIVLFVLDAYSQGISFFRATKKKGDNVEKVPTVITSDSLEIDVENNKATFFKKVKVDDEELTIECDKMTILLDSPQKSDPKEKKEKTDSMSIENSAAKQISRIVCEGNVIITRKMPVSAENPEPIQKSTSGHADYDVKTGMIVLTQDPVLSRGKDSLRGEIITIWRDSEKVTVKHGVKLDLNSENVKDAQNTNPSSRQGK